MIALATAAVLAALVGAPHCLGMCGGFALAAGRGSSLAYHAGRIGTYAVLGAIAGTVERWIPGPSWLATAISAVLVLGMAATMAGYVPEPSIRIPGWSAGARWLNGRSGPAASAGLGVLNGLLPCGLLYATLALPVASGSSLQGAAIMALFGVCTAVPLSLASRSFRELLQRAPRARPVLAILVALFGLGGLAVRVPTPGASDVPTCHEVP